MTSIALNPPTLSTLPMEIQYMIFDQILFTPRTTTITIRRKAKRGPKMGPLKSLSQTSKHFRKCVHPHVKKWHRVGLRLPPHLRLSATFGLVNLDLATFVIEWRDIRKEGVIRRHDAGTVDDALFRVFEWRQMAMWEVGRRQTAINKQLTVWWLDGKIYGEEVARALPDRGGKRLCEYMFLATWRDKRPERPKGWIDLADRWLKPRTVKYF